MTKLILELTNCMIVYNVQCTVLVYNVQCTMNGCRLRKPAPAQFSILNSQFSISSRRVANSNSRRELPLRLSALAWKKITFSLCVKKKSLLRFHSNVRRSVSTQSVFVLTQRGLFFNPTQGRGGAKAFGASASGWLPRDSVQCTGYMIVYSVQCTVYNEGREPVVVVNLKL